MSKTISVGEGFTLDEILNKEGFTLDMKDNPDLVDSEDDFDYSKNIELSNEEMLKYLNLEEDEEEYVNETEAVMHIGVPFDKFKLKMTSICPDDMVMKLIKREGVGEVIPRDAQVTIKYIGYFEHQDEPFDSSYAHNSRGDKTVRLSQGQLLPGLELGISTMKKHEIAVFIIHSSLAYGAIGCLPRIPPNAEVLFAVQLMDFLDNGSADTYENLSIEEKQSFPVIIKRVKDMLNTARDSFKRAKIRQAIREYNKAVKWLEEARLQNDEEEQEMNSMLSRALTNLVVCYNKEGKPKLACASFQRIPNAPTGKAIYQYGKALTKIGEYDDAMKQLQKANQMIPDSSEIIAEIKITNELRSKYMDYLKRFSKNCIRAVKDEKLSSEFVKTAAEMCDTFLNDINLMRQPLPEGLTPEEDKCIREAAAVRGLNISVQTRYGKNMTYLAKPSYM